MRTGHGIKPPSRRARGRGRGCGGGRGSSITKEKHLSQDDATRIKFELMPSISRSGGDNGEGDSLKNLAVQEDYWVMVQEKIRDYWKDFPNRVCSVASRTEKESNLLLFLRKLREGVLSSHRADKFALEIYETSFYLAVIFESSVHASSSLSHIPALYSSLLSKTLSNDQADLTRTCAKQLATVAIVFHLSETFPSQTTFRSAIRSFDFALTGEKDSAAFKWVSSIRTALNCRNYAQFEELTRESRISTILRNAAKFQDISAADKPQQRDYVRLALLSTVNALRSKLRNVTWSILRSAYREFALGADSDTAAWLSRSLFLNCVGDGDNLGAEEWIQQRSEDGHVIKKEGSPGRWTVKR